MKPALGMQLLFKLTRTIILRHSISPSSQANACRLFLMLSTPFYDLLLDFSLLLLFYSVAMTFGYAMVVSWDLSELVIMLIMGVARVKKLGA